MNEPSGEELLVKIVVDLYDDTFEVSGEGLWAKPLGDDLYEVRNSPWHNTVINYLDVVKAVAPSEDKKPVFVEVYKRSGHRTIHVYFVKKSTTEERQSVLQTLNDLGGTYEGANAQLYAIDLGPGVDFNSVAGSLQQFEEKGVLEARYAPQPQPRGTGELAN
jgi:Domain of unknown function (DUF4265)